MSKRILILAGAFTVASTSIAGAQHMYWTDIEADKIQRSCVNGRDVQDVLTWGLSAPAYIFVDSAGEKIYWTGRASIRRANLDGTDVETLVQGESGNPFFPRGIALDQFDGKMYWTDTVWRVIQRANLDGSEIETLPVLISVKIPAGIALDLSARKVYWIDTFNKAVNRANMDGTDAETIIHQAGNYAWHPTGPIALDAMSGKVFWSDMEGVYRANTDGTDREDLLPFPATGLAIDPQSQKLYIAGDTIRRANLDGSGVETLINADEGLPAGLALDPRPCGGDDCQPNGIPDGCDICDGLSEDCNWNDIPDECDIAAGHSADCNSNGVPDECDIAEAVSVDCNFNNTPDECEVEPYCANTASVCEAGHLVPVGAVDRDYVGSSVALQGDIAVIGAKGADPGGRVYVFEREGQNWNERAQIVPESNQPDDYFGRSVSMDGDRIVIGASSHDQLGESSGAAYVFLRIADGSWLPEAKLVASDGVAGDAFGASVAIAGDTIIIGALGVEDQGVAAGAAYVFTHTDGAWTETVKLYASDAAEWDRFGQAVSIADDYIVIAARGDDNPIENAGAVYVYRRNGATWVQHSKLTASDATVGDGFGESVAIEDNRLVVGATLDDDACFNYPDCNSGSAYVFRLDDNGTPAIATDDVWREEAKLRATDGLTRDYFGVSVSIDEDLVLVGAKTSGRQQRGIVYLFRLVDSGWVQDAFFTGAAYSSLGSSLAIDGEFLIAGALQEARDRGAAYILATAGPDCNADGLFDSCDQDCNDNDNSDVCDILAGSSDDVLPAGGNNIPDECELDCNGNEIPDPDDIDAGTSEDCNENAVPDECDLESGTSGDCNANDWPDECEPDCNENDQPDDCDISDGTSGDCNLDGTPDECQQDCNGNQVPDDCDITAGTSEDQNGDGYPDECEATNDFCADAIEIFAGSTPFPGLRATPDGLDLSYNCPIICEPSCPIPDIWYDYIAPEEGQVTISAVTDTGRDLSVLVFDTCSCPADFANLIGCGLWEQSVTFAAQAGACYRIQVESFWAATAEDAGMLTLTTNFPDPCPVRPPLTVFVDADAPPGGDGMSWGTAFMHVQDALAAASAPGSEVTEIRVAEGTYTPDPQGGDRTATFQLPPCVAVFGGYAGFGTADPDHRDIIIHETILSGDLVGDDPGELSDCCYGHQPGGCADAACEASVCASSQTCCGLFYSEGCVTLAEDLCGGLCANFLENSYHVVSAADVYEMAILDGFTITGGNADGPSPDDEGAGVECVWAAPTIRDCRIRRNRADDGGGGIHNCDGKIIGCEITENAVVFGLGGGLKDCDGIISGSTISANAARFGGGLFECGANVEDCTITGNVAEVGGGGMAYCDGTITNCSISGNTSGNAGAGVYECDGTISNCVISGNTARILGGGLARCDASVTNCTITGNMDTSFYHSGAVANCDGGFTNCIFWDNTNPWWYSSSPSPTYSCMPEGGFAGSGNVQADPLFVVPGYRDIDGQWVEGDYRLSSDSPCIDAGDDSAVPPDTTDLDGDGDTTEPIPFDLDGNFRFFGTVDIGAYEAPGALESPTLAPPPHDILKNRYISIDPRGASGANVGHDLDIRLTLSSTQVNGVTALGSEWWANSPDANCIAIVGPSRPATPPTWDACPTLHLTGCPIIPTSTYDIVMINGGAESDPPMAAATQAKPGVKWRGDAVGFFDAGTNTWTPPQGLVNIDDAVAAIKTFQDPSAVNATHVSVTDVHPNSSGAQINKVVNFDDVFDQILGFQGFEYPGSAVELCTDP